MLDHRLRRWSNIKTTQEECFVVSGWAGWTPGSSERNSTYRNGLRDKGHHENNEETDFLKKLRFPRKL